MSEKDSPVQVVEWKGLLLENVHPNDEGVYECSAENTIGRISETIQLFVQVRSSSRSFDGC
jgi:hypothetical protein